MLTHTHTRVTHSSSARPSGRLRHVAKAQTGSEHADWETQQAARTMFSAGANNTTAPEIPLFHRSALIPSDGPQSV